MININKILKVLGRTLIGFVIFGVFGAVALFLKEYSVVAILCVLILAIIVCLIRAMYLLGDIIVSILRIRKEKSNESKI